MLALQKGIVKRFEEADKLPPYDMELHVLRLGDIAITTNTFELYLDWDIQMKARRPAQQTFVLAPAHQRLRHVSAHRARHRRPKLQQPAACE